MKTSELTGAALDWAVAKCEGKSGDIEYLGGNLWHGRVTFGFTVWNPTTNWALTGPIIERECIALIPPNEHIDVWEAVHPTRMHNEEYGPTPLIAAMRCYVASKLGGEVEVPEELR